MANAYTGARSASRLPAEIDDDILDPPIGDADEDAPGEPPLADSVPKGMAGGILDLSCTNAHRAGLRLAPLPVAPVLEALHGPYRPRALGPTAARRALAAWLGGRGRAADPNHLVLTASTSEAFSYLIKWRCQPGDAVAHMQPGYPLAGHLIELEGCRPIGLRSTYSPHERRWQLDLGSVEAACRQGAKLMVLTSPNNPTGAVLSANEALAVGALCDAFGVVCVIDEVFAPYGQGCDVLAHAPLPPCQQLVCIAGLSKAALLPQLKLSWMHLMGSDAFVHQARLAMTWVGDAYLSVSALAAALVPAVCERMDALHAQVNERLRANKQWLHAFLRHHRLGKLMPTQGGFVAPVVWAARPPMLGDGLPWAGASPAPWLRALAQARVHLSEAALYDLPGADAVASLVVEPRALQRGWQRVLGAWEAH